MIIGLDWNNTVQDQIGKLIELSNGKLQKSNFAIWDDPSGAIAMGMSKKEFINWCWKSQDVQVIAKPFDNAGEIINKLYADGHYIRIITSSHMPVSKIADWFNRHSICFDEIIKTENKASVYFDLLIDDNPDVIRQMIDKNLPIAKFNLPWNSDIDCIGFSNWLEIYNSEIFEKAQ